MTDQAENDALSKDDLRTLKRLAKAKRDELRRRSETTADVLHAYDALIFRLNVAIATPPGVTGSGDRPGGA